MKLLAPDAHTAQIRGRSKCARCTQRGVQRQGKLPEGRRKYRPQQPSAAAIAGAFAVGVSWQDDWECYVSQALCRKCELAAAPHFPHAPKRQRTIQLVSWTVRGQWLGVLIWSGICQKHIYCEQDQITTVPCVQ